MIACAGSEQRDAGFPADALRVGIPQAALHLADVAGADELHAEPGLANAAPMVWGNSPASSILWKGSCRRSSQPASVS